MLKKLDTENLILYEKYGGIILLDKGKKIAESVKHKHDTITKILKIMLVPENIAENDSCKQEYNLSSEGINSLQLLLNSLKINQDTGNCFMISKTFAKQNNGKFKNQIKKIMEKSLIELREGEKGTIKSMLCGFGRVKESSEREHGAVKQLENLGIRIGKEVTVISIQPFGPIVIEIDGRETAIGRGRAAKIYVDV